MSGYEGAYSSLLQGVSQQLPKMRLQGQVTAQDNMLSDIVTNCRRRPGLAFRFGTPMPGETHLTIRAWSTDIAGTRVHVYIGTNTGRIVVLNDDQTIEYLNGPVAYLVAEKAQDIRGATVGDEFYLLNVGKQPTNVGPSEVGRNPAFLGFFNVLAGSFSKRYSATVTTNEGTVELVYTTPNGTGTGDAAASTVEAIAAAMLASGTARLAELHLDYEVRGAYVGLLANSTVVTNVAVTSSSGSTYITPSNNSKVRTEANLPAILPKSLNGYVMAVGEQKVLRYYRYDDSRTEWLECGSWGSSSGVSNMPISVTSKAGVWSVDTTAFEGRLAGDDETNPNPNYVGERKISGMAAFQNRLVLLCGSTVYLSASNKPRRFYRSTVTSLIDNDTIAVASSATSSAEYQYAVPFQKDLLLFSSKYQALIPSAGKAVTPRDATVLLTSAYSVDTLSEPVPVGRTLLFSAPRSADYFGFMEMVSSQYTDAQYVANDATAHLPKYMGGKCRFGVSSSVASMVMFAPSRDPNSLVVYEYSWDGDTKVQQAWHTWRFRYPIAAAYFSNESVNIIFIKNGNLVGCTMDPRQGVLSFESTRRPYLDFNVEIDVVDNKCNVPGWLMAFDPDCAPFVKLSVSSGPLAGEAVGVAAVSGSELTTVRSFPNGRVSIGFSYRSLFSPTPPIAQDRNGIKIESAKLTILRFGVSTQNSSEFMVQVTDSTTEDVEAMDQATLRFCSSELGLGKARYATTARAVVPARTEADTTTLSIFTEGTGELNITGLDYIGRFNTRIRRR